MPQRRNRREVLALAGIEVLAREGGRGLTHRAVDREAGVPEGTTKNYYPTRSALLVAIARYLADQHTAAMQQLCDQVPRGVTAREITTLYSTMLQRMVTSARAQLLALLELHLEAVRNPQVRAQLGRMARANVDAAVQLNGEAGRRMSRRGAALLDAGMLGVAISMLSLPEELAQDIGLDDPELLARSLLSLGTVGHEPPFGVVRGYAG
ncbi:TetR/AcrR family transcriptional regulator [Saccharopolyspora rectivirgula]|jgi:DNA-binding transcriptional regulator YbjK|uniref:TetR/AcrR family transcriptional regulator n=1 Tax=Saccharopolyspora rectivirgula TaxID=28042 RepID=UPI002409B47A|nr:TetR/AcrR family transcriptional regulator [Saccharopolyspora rectivirgula]